MNRLTKWLRSIDYAELIFRLFALVLILVLIPTMIILALISMVTVIVGYLVAVALSGIFAASRSIWRAARRNHRDATTLSDDVDYPAPRIGFLARIYKPQPAYILYLFDAGWRVLEGMMSHARSLNKWATLLWIGRGRKRIRAAREAKFNLWEYPASFVSVMSGTGMILGAFLHRIVAFVVLLIMMGLFTILLLIGMVLSSIGMLVIGLYNRVRTAIYRMSTRCPNCHEQFDIPVYVCPTCGRQHTRLWPSIYGVTHHTCVCGEVLPTLDIFGRRDVVQRCPSCDYVLNEAIGRARNLHIPIVGGPSAGKTHYIIATTRELMERYAPQNNVEITMPDTHDFQNFVASVEQLRHGQQLPKTAVEQDSHTRAYNLKIQRPRQRVPSLLYIYDGAGEYYTSQESAQEQTYYKYVNGFIMIVDPFTIEGVYQQYQPQLDETSHALAVNVQQPLSGIYERMLETLELYYDLNRGVKFPHKIAVVVTKVDAFDLEQRIGLPAALRAVQRNPDLTTVEDAINSVTQTFLIRSGAGNFVRNLHAQFESVRFFSCSSTGRMINPNDQRDFVPVRVMDPLVWLLAESQALPPQKYPPPSAYLEQQPAAPAEQRRLMG